MSYFKSIFAALLLQVAVASSPQGGSIEGKVTGANGEVLSAATVTLVRPNAPNAEPFTTMAQAIGAQPGVSAPTAITDADGRFTIPNVPPGSYRIRASKQGFAGREYGQKGPNGSGVLISITPGQKLANVELAIQAQGVIVGRVFDQNGVPEVRALVQASVPRYLGPVEGRQLIAAETTTTDDQGYYRLFWLNPGTYLISATSEGSYGTSISVTPFEVRVSASSTGLNNSVYMNNSSTDERSRLTTYYPGVVKSKDATAVAVRPGATTPGIDIEIASLPVRRIRGVTINGNTGTPESMLLSLMFEDEGRNGRLDRYSSDNGEFEFGGLLPGSYILGARSGNFGAMVPVNVGSTNVSNVVVRSQAQLFTISGRFVGEGIAAINPDQNLGVRIRLTSNQNTVISSTPSVEIHGREFTIRTVTPGDYRVTIEGNPTLLLKSVRLGNQDSTDVLRIQSQPESPMELELVSRTGHIDGRVFNERHEPVSNATVVLVPDPPLRQRTNMYVTPDVDTSGIFHINTVPGFYKLFAWEDIETGLWTDMGFISRNEGRGRSIVIADGQNDAIEIPVIPYIP